MKPIITIITVGLLASGAWAKDIEWQKTDDSVQKNYDSALAKAKKDKKVVLVDIYTDWCGWCKKLDRDTYSDKDVQAKVAKDFIAVKVNPEKSAAGSALARQFGVRGYPFIAFVDADGKKISQIGGYVNATAFLSQLEQVAKQNNAK